MMDYTHTTLKRYSSISMMTLLSFVGRQMKRILFREAHITVAKYLGLQPSHFQSLMVQDATLGVQITKKGGIPSAHGKLAHPVLSALVATTTILETQVSSYQSYFLCEKLS